MTPNSTTAGIDSRRPEPNETPRQYCHDPRHGTPCPQPCNACVDECDPAYLKDGAE